MSFYPADKMIQTIRCLWCRRRKSGPRRIANRALRRPPAKCLDWRSSALPLSHWPKYEICTNGTDLQPIAHTNVQTYTGSRLRRGAEASGDGWPPVPQSDGVAQFIWRRVQECGAEPEQTENKLDEPVPESHSGKENGLLAAPSSGRPAGIEGHCHRSRQHRPIGPRS